jgi:hypothetical protein
MGCSEDYDPVSAVFVTATEVKPAPIHATPEKRALFEKTLAAIGTSSVTSGRSSRSGSSTNVPGSRAADGPNGGQT